MLKKTTVVFALTLLAAGLEAQAQSAPPVVERPSKLEYELAFFPNSKLPFCVNGTSPAACYNQTTANVEMNWVGEAPKKVPSICSNNFRVQCDYIKEKDFNFALYGGVESKDKIVVNNYLVVKLLQW